MTSRRWTVWALFLTLLVGGGVVGANVWLDPYGLFRDTKGRPHYIWGSEHRAKFLLSRNYVPENFEGIVVGSSVSDNWRVQDLKSFRFYNESTDGGNITAQRIIGLRALERPGIVAAICVVHPYMTFQQGLVVADMTEAERWGALGSLSLFSLYPHVLRTRLLGKAPVWDEFGSEEVPAPFEMNDHLRAVMLPEGEIHVDPKALDEYRDLIGEFHRRGLFVTAVVPPSSEEILAAKRAEMSRFVETMRSMFGPDDLFVDFTAQEYQGIRRAPDHFKDGVHLTSKGMLEVIRALNQRIEDRRFRR